MDWRVNFLPKGGGVFLAEANSHEIHLSKDSDYPT